MSSSDLVNEQLSPEEFRELEDMESELRALIKESETTPTAKGLGKSASELEESVSEEGVSVSEGYESVLEEYEALLDELEQGRPKEKAREELIAQLARHLEAARETASRLSGKGRVQERERIQQEIRRIEDQQQTLAEQLKMLKRQLAEL